MTTTTRPKSKKIRLVISVSNEERRGEKRPVFHVNEVLSLTLQRNVWRIEDEQGRYGCGETQNGAIVAYIDGRLDSEADLLKEAVPCR